MERTTRCGRLLCCLEQGLQSGRALEALLAEEQAALLRLEMDALEALLARKREALAAMADFQHTLEAWLAGEGLRDEHDLPALAARLCGADSPAARRAGQLQAVLLACRTLSRSNGQLVQQGMGQAMRGLRLLRALRGEDAECTYGPPGETAAPRRIISHA